jgi:hypothetical protein
MAAVLIIGGGLGWLVYCARAQREAVAAIEAADGKVYYDWEWQGDPCWTTRRSRPRRRSRQRFPRQ